MSDFSESSDPSLLSRREAIRRATLFLGAALSPSLLAGAVHGQSATPAAAAAPGVLSASQLETVSAVADRILPRTDTPGASDVGVPAFIQRMVSGYYTPEERKTFVEGLAQLDAASRSQQGAAFARLEASRQDELLRALAVASQKGRRTFFHLIREATIVGYFTSEIVGTTVTHYDPVPGRFDACIPISEVGNVVWTR